MRVIDSLIDLVADTDFESLRGFQLDEADLFETLTDAVIEDVEITQISAAQLQGVVNGTTVTLSGGQLAPARTGQELLDSINTAFADGTLTQITFVNEEREFLSIELTDSGYLFQSGNQRIEFTADWPKTLIDIFDLTTGLSNLQRIADLTREERSDLQDIVDTNALSRIVVFDDDVPLIDLTFSDQSLAISASGLTIGVSVERVGDAQTLQLTIDGLETSTRDAFKFSSANLSELSDYWPEIEDGLGMAFSLDERARIEALIDHTYLNYTLEQFADGPFSFTLNARIDQFFRDEATAAIAGTNNDDTLIGTSLDDLLIGEEGNDQIDGGQGQDTARFYGLGHDFAIQITTDGVLVSDRSGASVETDQLTNVEAINFDDHTLLLGSLDWVESVSQAEIATLVQLYVAYFGRAPDAEGMLFWLNAIEQGLELPEVAKLFFDQPETRAQLADVQDTAEFVTATYAKVLGRAPDAAGLEFWSDVLESDAVAIPNFVQAMIDGALNNANAPDDQKYLNDKTDIGVYFAFIRGLTDVTQAQAAMANFDGSDQSVLDARAGIDQMYQDALDGEPALLIGMADLIADPFSDGI